MSTLTGLESEALRLYGLSQADIDSIDLAIPAAERLVDLVTSAQPLIDEALALFAKAQPILAQANVELKLVMPAAQAIRAFIVSRAAAAPSPSSEPSGYEPGATM